MWQIGLEGFYPAEFIQDLKTSKLQKQILCSTKISSVELKLLMFFKFIKGSVLKNMLKMNQRVILFYHLRFYYAKGRNFLPHVQIYLLVCEDG